MAIAAAMDRGPWSGSVHQPDPSGPGGKGVGISLAGKLMQRANDTLIHPHTKRSHIRTQTVTFWGKNATHFGRKLSSATALTSLQMFKISDSKQHRTLI